MIPTSKTDLIDEGRRQGFLTAYKIVKQAAEEGKDPVAVLKAELDYRKITKIMSTAWERIAIKKRLDDWINGVPSVQPERTCVNCGRTMNNGGWYADGRTRCPIEEHYALPKGGFCHLWEKRNITDDDYPERRTDG